jgi:ATP-dependent Lon protease
MTGEISLQGRVLPVGGVREKVLAAYRAGIHHVILPKDNESDLSEVPPEVRGKMKFHLVSEVSEVFKIALIKKPKARRQ